MNNIPKTTLFMLSSLDGKISSGDTDKVDSDQDWKRIKGVKEGLGQYYELEKHTDIVSLNTGRVMTKIVINERKPDKKKLPVSFILIDNKPHLKASGLNYLSHWLKHVYIVTTNRKHPALAAQKRLKNITVIRYAGKIDFKDLFRKLKRDYAIRRVTIQSGGKMNSVLLRAGLIDRVSLVVAPLLVGGAMTPTLIDGEAVHGVKELYKLRALKLVQAKRLKDSYLHLIYKVLN